MVEQHEVGLTSKKNIADEDIAGDAQFDKNFSDQVLNMIAEHNFKKQTPKKITYLKPTKAALYGLHLRFQAVEKREAE